MTDMTDMTNNPMDSTNDSMDFDNLDASTPSESYLIHDNGDRPFKVVITSTCVSVYEDDLTTDYEPDDSDSEEDYHKLVYTIPNYTRVFVGEDPACQEYKGNTILVYVGNTNGLNKYVFIEGIIYSFETSDTISEFVSPVGNSDVPYAYAVGSQNTYLLTLKTYIPNQYLTNNQDPYSMECDQYEQSMDTNIVYSITKVKRNKTFTAVHPYAFRDKKYVGELPQQAAAKIFTLYIKSISNGSMTDLSKPVIVGVKEDDTNKEFYYECSRVQLDEPITTKIIMDNEEKTVTLKYRNKICRSNSIPSNILGSNVGVDNIKS